MTGNAGWGPYGPAYPYRGAGGYPVPGGGSADPGTAQDGIGGFAVPAAPPLTGYPQPGSAGYERPVFGQAPDGQVTDPPYAPWPYSPYSTTPTPPYSDRYPSYPEYAPDGGAGCSPGQYPPYQEYAPGGGAGCSPGQHPPQPQHDPYQPDPYQHGPYQPGPYQPDTYPPGTFGAVAYGPGYPSWPRHSRPGSLTAAAVLAFVTAGLDLAGCLAAVGVADEVGLPQPWWTQYLWVLVVAALVAGGLLIAGGVLALRGRPRLLLAGAVITAAVAVCWVPAFWASDGDTETALRMYPPIYLALAVVMTALAYGPAARQWRPHEPGTG